MNNTLQTLMKPKYDKVSLEAWVIRCVRTQKDTDIFNLLFEIAAHGGSSGAVPALISHADILSFYRRYNEKIWECVYDFCQKSGLTLGQFLDTSVSPIQDEVSFRTALSWFAIEKTAHKLCCLFLPY